VEISVGFRLIFESTQALRREAQGLVCNATLTVKRYLRNFISACMPSLLTPAPADVSPTFAFTPTPHRLSQHLAPSFVHDPEPSQQHPDVAPTMATATTIIIELTFMDYLTFLFAFVSTENRFRSDGEMIPL
jgi:hypothetical protein